MTTITRRHFLGALGAGAIASSTSSLLASPAAHAQHQRRRFVIREDRFGRMFPELPPFARRARHSRPPCGTSASPAACWTPRTISATAASGGDQPDRRSRPEPEQPEQPDAHGRHHVHGPVPGPRHDVRPDLAARRADRAADSPNARTPGFDLDSVYGGGPRDPAALRAAREPGGTKLRIESGGLFEDLPRNARRQRDHRRPAQRREHDHRRPAGGVPPVPQPRRRPRARSDRRRRSDEVFDEARAAHDLALPVDDRARVPAALHRPGRW